MAPTMERNFSPQQKKKEEKGKRGKQLLLTNEGSNPSSSYIIKVLTAVWHVGFLSKSRYFQNKNNAINQKYL